MVRLKVPPYEVNIFLRFRFSSQHRPCCFSRARPANYQLDIELLRPAGNPWDIQNIEDLRYDPVGCRHHVIALSEFPVHISSISSCR